jgi:hypothetical protein
MTSQVFLRRANEKAPSFFIPFLPISFLPLAMEKGRIQGLFSQRPGIFLLSKDACLSGLLADLTRLLFKAFPLAAYFFSLKVTWILRTRVPSLSKLSCSS